VVNQRAAPNASVTTTAATVHHRLPVVDPNTIAPTSSGS
jgi:hypothetical protein